MAVLLIAFLTTSGITFVNLNNGSSKTEAAQNTTTPQETELDRWRKDAKEKPTDASAQANLAFFLLNKADNARNAAEASQAYAEAATSLQAALKIDKDYAFAIRLLGQMSLTQGHGAEAAKYYQQALDVASKPVDPKDKDADSKVQNQKAEQIEDHLGLAMTDFQEKHPDESFKQFDEALKIDPGNAKIYALRSQAYQEQGQKELARKDLQTLEKIARATNNANMAQMAAVRLYMLDAPAAGETPAAGAATPAPGASATPIQILPPPLAAPEPSATPAAATPAPASPTPAVSTAPTP